MERINSYQTYTEKALYIGQKKSLQETILQAEEKTLQALREYEALDNAKADDAIIDSAYARYEQANELYRSLMNKRDAVDNIISLLDSLTDELEYLETC